MLRGCQRTIFSISGPHATKTKLIEIVFVFQNKQKKVVSLNYV